MSHRDGYNRNDVTSSLLIWLGSAGPARGMWVLQDVLGMIGDQSALLGECRWQASPLTNRDLIDLQRKIAYIPDPGDDLTLMFWSRSGTAEQGFPSKVWSADDVIM